MKKSEDRLLVVPPNGQWRSVPCTYEGIKSGLDDATFDFVHNDAIGMYVDDEGMLKELDFNVPASLFMGRALYGPVVLCAAQADEEGNTLPADKEEVGGLAAICRLWLQVLADAARLGQVVITTANEATIPPPVVYHLDDKEFGRFLTDGVLPEREADA